MNLSRKEFLRRGLLSLGEALLNPAPLLHSACERGSGVAVALIDHCLAQRGGCFSCLESCPQEAIALELGIGVRIDEEKCTGCGRCADICPVTPKALAIAPRTPRPTAYQEAQSKGEP